MHYHSINGKINKEISIADRAFNYGDGIFTTAKICHGKIEFLAQHMERLRASCKMFAIDFSQKSEIISEITSQAKHYTQGVIKIVISAGQGGRGYSRKGVGKSNVVISIHDVPEHYEMWQQEGIELGTASYQLGLNPMLKGIKQLNRLEQVLIRAELDKRSEDDLVVTNIKGHVIEASAANIFWFKGEQLFTPNLDESGIFGIIRQEIIDINSAVNIVSTDINSLEEATAMFICNSVMGIIPVKTYKGRALDLKPVKKIQASLFTADET